MYTYICIHTHTLKYDQINIGIKSTWVSNYLKVFLLYHIKMAVNTITINLREA